MWNEPRQDKLNGLPKLYATEHVDLMDKTIHMHFFILNTDFLICEYDGLDTFWGFVVLAGDLFNSEWGYISFSELNSIKIQGLYEVEHDEYWQVRPAREVKLICEAQGWNYNKIKNDYVGASSSMPFMP